MPEPECWVKNLALDYPGLDPESGTALIYKEGWDSISRSLVKALNEIGKNHGFTVEDRNDSISFAIEKHVFYEAGREACIVCVQEQFSTIINLNTWFR